MLKKEDESLIDVEHVETTYCDIGLVSFLLHFLYPSQSCFSRILCNLLHFLLWPCSLVHAVGVIHLNISTPARRLNLCCSCLEVQLYNLFCAVIM